MSTPSTPSYRNRLAYHSALLGFMALLVSSVLVIANTATHEDIKKRQEEDLVASLSKVVSAGSYDNNLLADSLFIRTGEPAAGKVEVFRARAKTEVIAALFRVTGKGYAGDIDLIMGVSRNGELTGVRVLSHMETPGLGDKIEERKDDWILGFTGLSLKEPEPGRWKVKKDGGHFDQFTGATITPRAVVDAVREGLDFFQRHRKEILTTPAKQTTPESTNGA